MNPWPKPEPRAPREPRRMKRSPMKRGRRRSRFPAKRNPAYLAELRANPCVLAGHVTRIRVCPYDVQTLNGWAHRCWGPIDAMHVNDTQGTGAGDVGETAPGCRGTHRALDARLGPATFAQVTGLDLSYIAQGYALRWVERGGVV